MKITQAGAFVAMAASLSTFTYGYSFTDRNPVKASDDITSLSVNEQSNIYGGVAANIKNFPFLAGLRDPYLDLIICSATLIAPQYLITAGHCVKKVEGLIATFGTNASSGGAALRVLIIEQYRHPLYKKKEHLYDVGLVKLEKPIRRTPAKLCAADGSDNKVGTVGTVVGWGKTEELEFSPILEQLTLPIISNAECGKFEKYVGRITDGMLCAGNGEGKDTCNGDSGGPLLVEGNILIGCVSWGSKCGEQAAIFTRLTYVMDYILDILAGGDGSRFNVTSSVGSSTQEVLSPSSPAGFPTDARKVPLKEVPTESNSKSSDSEDLAWLLKLFNSKDGMSKLEQLFGSDSGSGIEDPVQAKGGKTRKNLNASKLTKTPIEESLSESDGSSEDSILMKRKATQTSKLSETTVDESST